MSWRREFSLFGRGFAFYTTKLPNIMTTGISNECDGDSAYEYVTFLDYDEVSLDVVHDDIRRLHNIFGLCTFVIIKSSERDFPDPINPTKKIGSYHVISPCKIMYNEMLGILQQARCDDWFKKVGSTRYSRRNWVLRIGPKIAIKSGKTIKDAPVIEDVVYFEDPGCNRNHSSAHCTFLDNNYGLSLMKALKFQDNRVELEVVQYNTVGKV